VNDEKVVFDSIMKWIDHDLLNRSESLRAFIRSVRLGLLSEEDLTSVKDHALVINDEQCSKYVTDAYNVIRDASQGIQYALQCPLMQSRLPQEIMIVVGGQTDIGLSECGECYDRYADRWTVVNHNCQSLLLVKRCDHGMCAMESYLYLIGGCDTRTHLNTAVKFDMDTMSVSEIACLHKKRSQLSVTEMDKKIYAIGGFDGVPLNDVEVYSDMTRRWTEISPMYVERAQAGVTNDARYIFVAGGHGITGILKSVEMYNPMTHQWSFLSELKKPRIGCCMVYCLK